MKTKGIIFIILIVLNLCSCNSRSFLTISEKADLNVTRFSITDDKTGKRYSGIFNEKKEVLFYDEGIIYPFKGGFSYIHKNNRENTIIDITGKSYTIFELSEVYDSFYGYGLYSIYDSKNDSFCIINETGNKISNKKIIDISENIEIVRKNKKMTYFNIVNKSYLKNNKLYDICYSFQNGIAKIGIKKTGQSVYNETYLYGLVDTNGYVLLPCEFSYIDYRCPKYIAVSKNCEDPLWERRAEFGMVDLNNNWIIEPKYHYVLPVTDTVAALWIIEENKEYWVLHNIRTKEYKAINSNYTLIDNINLFTKNNTDNIILFYDLAEKKYGFINTEGDIVLKPVCERIESNPDNGFYQVLINGNWMLFKENEGVLDPKKYLDFNCIQ